MILGFKKWATHTFHEMGGSFLFLIKVIQLFLKTQNNTKAIMQQIASISTRSFLIISFAGIFVGAILVIQLHLILAKYDAQSFLGGLNTSTVVREVGPLLISFLLAGKIGAFTTAELGTMRVTEQIDAIECLGANPLQYLVVPRLIGIVLASVILLMMGLLVSIFGSMFISSFFYNINIFQYVSSIPTFVSFTAVAGAIFKSVLYGTIIGTVSCEKGFYAHGGARGVGKAVTVASVYTNFYILLANFSSTHFLDFLWKVYQSYLGAII